MNKLLTTAISGRQGAGSMAADDGKVDGQKFISAVQEAYPDLGGLKVYDRLLDQVQAMRKAFAADQTKLADQVRGYDQWRTTGSLIHPWLVSELGFPSNRLQIHIGSKVLVGREALDKLSVVIMTGESEDLFRSGQDRQIKLK
jgi:hypothetical protein